MYNLRYHIASLVSVFLALALGLILGGLVVGKGTIDKQQGALVEGLRKEFTQLRDENRTLVAQNRMLTSFSDDVVGQWTADRLAGRTIVVVTTGGLDDSVDAVRRAAGKAGATVAVATILKPNIGAEEKRLPAIVASAGADPSEALQSIATSLALEWGTAAADRPLTEALSEAELLEVEGLADDALSSGLVLVAGRQGQPDAFGLALARSFDALPKTAIGAEMPDTGTGVARSAAGAGLPSLDTLGTQVGRYTLVALLWGAPKAYYGTGPDAAGPYPPISFD